VATFDAKNPKVADDGYVEVRLGIIGCPPSTRQIIFFTDDESFVDDPNELEDDLCLVLRDQPVRGTIWASKPQSWDVMGDFRLFAVGVTGDARTFSVSSTLCDALEERNRIAGSETSEGIQRTIRRLRSEDGAEWPSDQIPSPARLKKVTNKGRKNKR
jgi:hypothetical protein